MNPVTLKELRQLTRSRSISGAIIGFFLLQLVVAALVILASTNDDGTLDSDTGEMVFAWLAALLAPLVAFVVPGNLFARLVSEHGTGRAELLLATSLPPSAFIDGKIRSGLLLSGVFIAGALPFLLLSYLLRGIDMMVILSWTFSVAFFASFAVHISLFLASTRLPATARRCLWAFCALPCVPFALLSAEGYRHMVYEEGLAFHLATAACVVTANLLLRGLAIAQLSPRNTDRARPLRLTVAALWPLLLAVFAGIGLHETALSNATLAFSSLMGAGVLFLAAFELASPSGPSRRVLLDRPDGRWRRLLRWPFATGFESGLAFTLLLLGAGALLGLFVLHHGHATPAARNGWLATHIAYAYILATLLISRSLLHIPAIGRRIPVRATALVTVILLTLASLLPNILAINGGIDADVAPFNLVGISLSTLQTHFLYAVASFTLGLLLHLRALLRSARSYIGDRT